MIKMQYLCHKCGNFMGSISTCLIPEYTYYKCLYCGYKSKSTKEQPLYTTLPKELWSESENKNGFNAI